MIDWNHDPGKWLVSDRTETLFYGFPESDRVRTLIAGMKSPPIDSFIEWKGGEYWQLLDTGGDFPENVYLKASDHLKVVDDNYREPFTPLKSLAARTVDAVSNAATRGGKYAGFVSDGFRDSVSKMKVDSSGFLTEVRNILIAVGVAVALLVVFNITSIRR